MSTLFSLNTFSAFNTLRAGLLTGSLLAGGCVGDEETIDPVTPQGPAPIQVQTTPTLADLVPHADGTYYGSSSYAFSREDTEGRLLVAAQISCPTGYFIEGSCTARLRYPDDEMASHLEEPSFADICFNPQLGPENGLEACVLGALVCAVSLPGDRTETTTVDTGDGQSTVSETILGADRAELRLDFRCLPSE